MKAKGILRLAHLIANPQKMIDRLLGVWKYERLIISRKTTSGSKWDSLFTVKDDRILLEVDSTINGQ